MRVVVCVRRGTDGELGAFDAAAYEAALRIPGAEVIILSMGPAGTAEYLLQLTRLGAKKAVLLCDPMFAGSDTLATAYILSLAVKKLQPQLVLCGRQTLVGDTGQTGAMLSVLAGLPLITQVISIDGITDQVTCTTREIGERQADLPAVLTLERIYSLRLPSILSRVSQVETWSAQDLGADPGRCGLQGSPTRVLQTTENTAGKRKCRFISPGELPEIIEKSLQKDAICQQPATAENFLDKVCIVGEAPRAFAETVSRDITVLPLASAEELAEAIKKLAPNAVLWGSDGLSKERAAQVSAMLGLGLCADCTRLETDGNGLIMYRPAFSGSLIAKIHSRTKPAMATIRTAEAGGQIVVAAGWGVKDRLYEVKAYAQSLGAELAASRRLVDNGLAPYVQQVGLTGRTVSPQVYIAVGISGAVHHIAGMQRSGTVIAINPDKNAPIFEYADYGITADFPI